MSSDKNNKILIVFGAMMLIALVYFISPKSETKVVSAKLLDCYQEQYSGSLLSSGGTRYKVSVLYGEKTIEGNVSKIAFQDTKSMVGKNVFTKLSNTVYANNTRGNYKVLDVSRENVLTSSDNEKTPLDLGKSLVAVIIIAMGFVISTYVYTDLTSSY